MHLREGRRPVGEEHQAVLTEDDIDRSVGKRHLLRAAMLPGDVQPLGRALAARHRQHRGVRVEADDMARRTYQRRNRARDDPRAAGDVEHAGAGRDGRPGDDLARQWGEDGGNEPRFIDRHRVGHGISRQNAASATDGALASSSPIPAQASFTTGTLR
jgi:hypothetical protein